MIANGRKLLDDYYYLFPSTSAYVEFSGWVFRSDLLEVSMDWYLPLRAGSFCDPSFASVLDCTIKYYGLVRTLLRNDLGQSLQPKLLATYEDTERINLRTARLGYNSRAVPILDSLREI